MEKHQKSLNSDSSIHMKEEILKNLNNPALLEMLYRNNKVPFQKAFLAVYPEIKGQPAADIWNERLSYKSDEIDWGNKRELTFIGLAILIAGFIVKIPDIANLDEELFFSRNFGFIVFPLMTVYFIWRQELPLKKLLVPLLCFGVFVIYINVIPNNSFSDSVVLAYIHLPIFLWTVVGYAFTGTQFMNYHHRINFLRFNGDLVVMGAVITLAGGLFTALTFNLFQLLEINIGQVYEHYIFPWGIPAVPLLATFLVMNNPQLVSRISPVIARIFTPLVFVMLLIFLIAVIYTGKDPYNDRNFLILFNAMLIGVMALILFSVSEATRNTWNQLNLLLLFSLSLLTIVVNGIALSAIAFRLVEFGLTPNRLAVLGGDLLIFVNLLFIAHSLFMSLRKKMGVEQVENKMAMFLPIYSAWMGLVALIFPLLF